MDKYPNSPLAHEAALQLGRMYEKENKLDEAIACFQQFLAKAPAEDSRVALYQGRINTLQEAIRETANLMSVE